MTALCMNTSFSDGRTDLLIAHHIEESAERVRQVANYTRLWVEQAQVPAFMGQDFENIKFRCCPGLE